MNITSQTKLYCIFGKPVSHSLSPVLHNCGFAVRQIDAVYCAFEPSDIGSAIEAMKVLGINGASVTVPFKVDVIQYINALDTLAADIGAVNTLINQSGIITGYNTDGLGACEAMRNAGMKLPSSSALVIGNGGSARAIVCSLLSQGCAVTICGRNESRISALTAEFKQKYSGLNYIRLDELEPSYTKKFTAIINTTPVGMEPNTDDTPLSAELLHNGQYVFDIVYKPDKTRLLKDAEKRGCKIIKGFEMLLAQGILQFKLWTNQDAPEQEMREAAEDFLRQ